MIESKAMILGVAGQSLTADELAFFRDERPWGFILFARNISEASQIQDLCASMRETVGRSDTPIFIDQEGGRVQRLRPPLAPNYPTAAALGSIFAKERDAGLRAIWLMSRLHAIDLQKLGINANCLPVLDVPIQGAHDVIGDRAYGNRPGDIAQMGRAASDGLMAGGVLPVMKHVPGHGRAAADSHLELPYVDASLEDLRKNDFLPFRELNDLPMAMTAHVVYSALDPDNPATTSERIISQIIRQEIGFDGLLMSDDVSMKALSGDFAIRTKAIFAAGCDVALHCNGVFAEMQAVAHETPELAGKPRHRADRALQAARTEKMDEESLRAEFAGIGMSIA